MIQFHEYDLIKMFLITLNIFLIRKNLINNITHIYKNIQFILYENLLDYIKGGFD